MHYMDLYNSCGDTHEKNFQAHLSLAICSGYMYYIFHVRFYGGALRQAILTTSSCDNLHLFLDTWQRVALIHSEECGGFIQMEVCEMNMLLGYDISLFQSNI